MQPLYRRAHFSPAREGVVACATELAGRVLLAVLFLAAGANKVFEYDKTARFMESMGVSHTLLPLVIALNLIGATAIILGWRTRVAAFLLGGFTILATLIFHTDFSNQLNLIMLLKNTSIAGAFLLLVARGAGRYSLDARKAG